MTLTPPFCAQANGYTIDYDDWHAHVHGTLPYELVTRNEPLRRLLQQVKLPMYVFTNADDKHAAICLQRMGIADLFHGVITFERIQDAGQRHGKVHRGVPVVCKPARLAFEYALQYAGGAEARTSVFFDDSTRNVASAASLGIYSVLVGRVGVNSGADVELLSLLDLPTAAPALWSQMTTGVACPLPSLRTAEEELSVEVRQASDSMPMLMRRLSMEGGASGQHARVDAWGSPPAP